MSCDKYPADRNIYSLATKYRDRFAAYHTRLEDTFPQFTVVITETLRRPERQACLLKTGASKTKHSNHQDGIAMDIALLRNSTGEIDWRPAVYRNMYRLCDPRKYGLTSGAHLWGWDEGHLQCVEAQGPGNDLGLKLEQYAQ